MRLFAVALVFAAGSAVAQEAPPSLALDLHLQCAAGKADPAAGHIDDEVLVDILGDQARIRFPSAALPHRRGGDADWKPISDLQVDDHLIAGQVALNLLGHQALNIDRMTGRIDIGGAKGSGFHGDCAAVDQNAAPKF
jgi:hypothetical protein